MTRNRILIVEDEGIIAEDLRQTLTARGYDVIGISVSGKDAIRQSCAGRPELISMDVRLRGDMDGIETDQQIKRNLDVPIIFVTSNCDNETIQRAKAVSPWFLCKPLNEMEFMKTMVKALVREGV